MSRHWMTSMALVVALMVTVMTAATAHAQQGADTWTDNPTAVDAHLGFLSPQGLLGLGVTHTWERHWGLSASAGWNGDGVNTSLMARAQLPWSWGAVGLGAGLTGATEYTKFDIRFLSDNDTQNADFVLLANAELFVVLQDPQSGIRVSAYWGMSQGLAAWGPYATPYTNRYEAPRPNYPIDESEVLDLLPYAGLSVGYAF